MIRGVRLSAVFKKNDENENERSQSLSHAAPSRSLKTATTDV